MFFTIRTPKQVLGSSGLRSISRSEELEELHECPLCGWTEFQVVYEFRWLSYLQRGWNLAIVQCQRCRLRFTNPRVAKSHALLFYPDSSFEKDRQREPSQISKILGNQLYRVRMMNALFARPGKLLDIGCANGFFLAVARMSGWDCVGVELSDYAASFARERFKLDVRTGSLEQQKFPSKYFDAITMYDVIEHLYDPLDTVRRCHRLLSTQGRLIVSTMDMGCLYARLAGKRWPYISPEAHLFYFDRHSLTRLMYRANFRVCSLARLDYALRPFNATSLPRFGVKLLKEIKRVPQTRLNRRHMILPRFHDNLVLVAAKTA